jgi:glycosyltransferase involved in cell wall biosynthesis
MNLVSVIIPAYNRAECIERALKSALNQTYKHMEILIIDDASTDKTRDIVRDYQSRDSRIQLLCLSENRGAGAARNLGMQAARGEYVAFLDSDDEWLPDKLILQVERMNAETQEIGVCLCGATIIKNGDVARPVTYFPNEGWEHDTFRKFVTGKIMFLTPTILFRRSCLELSGLMVPAMRRNQDGEFFLRLFSHYGLAVIPKPFAIIHAFISPKYTHYDALSVSLPFRLRHRQLIRERLGLRVSILYACIMRTNLLQAAIRERRWHDAWRDFCLRIQEFPIFYPKEVISIFKALLGGLIRRGQFRGRS